MKKRILALVLSIAMVLSFVPFSAFAEGETVDYSSGLNDTASYLMKVPDAENWKSSYRSQSTRELTVREENGENFIVFSGEEFTVDAGNEVIDAAEFTYGNEEGVGGIPSTITLSDDITTMYIAIRVKYNDNSAAYNHNPAIWRAYLSGTGENAGAQEGLAGLKYSASQCLYWYDLTDGSKIKFYTQSGYSSSYVNSGIEFVGNMDGYVLFPLSNYSSLTSDYWYNDFKGIQFFLYNGSAPTVSAGHKPSSWADRELLIGDAFLVSDADAFQTARNTAKGISEEAGSYTKYAPNGFADTAYYGHRVPGFESFHHYKNTSAVGKTLNDPTAAGSADNNGRTYTHITTLPNGDRAYEVSLNEGNTTGVWQQVPYTTYDFTRDDKRNLATRGLPENMYTMANSAVSNITYFAYRVAVKGGETETATLKIHHPIDNWTNSTVGIIAGTVVTFIDANTGAVSEYTVGDSCEITITGDIDGWFLVDCNQYGSSSQKNYMRRTSGGDMANDWGQKSANIASTKYDLLTGWDDGKTLYVGNLMFVCDVEAFTAYHTDCTKSGHEYGEPVVKEATCVEAGSITYTCQRENCTDKTKVIELPALNHNYDDGVTVEATCYKAGSITYTCQTEGCTDPILVEEIPTIEHTWDEGTVTTEATCTATGVKTFECTVEGCDATKTEDIKKIAHTTWSSNPEDYTVVYYREASCTKTEHEQRACAVCGAIRGVNLSPALGHEDGGIVETVEATCTTDGYVLHTCSRCEETYKTDEVAATGHDIDSATEVVAPTCTEVGYTKHTCSECNESYNTDEVAATGHNSDTVLEAVKPTCTQVGHNAGTACSNCGEVQSGYEEIAATGHTYGEATIIAPEVLKPGYTLEICETCGYENKTQFTSIAQNTIGIGIFRFSYDADNYGTDAESKLKEMEEVLAAGYTNVVFIDSNDSLFAERVQLCRKYNCRFWTGPGLYSSKTMAIETYMANAEVKVRKIQEAGAWDIFLGFNWDEPIWNGMSNEDFYTMTKSLYEKWGKRNFVVFCTATFLESADNTATIMAPEYMTYLTDASWDHYYFDLNPEAANDEKQQAKLAQINTKYGINVTSADEYYRWVHSEMMEKIDHDVNVWFFPTAVSNISTNSDTVVDEAYWLGHLNFFYDLLKEQTYQGGLILYNYGGSVEDPALEQRLPISDELFPDVEKYETYAARLKEIKAEADQTVVTECTDFPFGTLDITKVSKDAITYNAVEGMQYSIDGGATYNTDGKFEGLTAETTYTIRVTDGEQYKDFTVTTRAEKPYATGLNDTASYAVKMPTELSIFSDNYGSVGAKGPRDINDNDFVSTEKDADGNRPTRYLHLKTINGERFIEIQDNYGCATAAGVNLAFGDFTRAKSTTGIPAEIDTTNLTAFAFRVKTTGGIEGQTSIFDFRIGSTKPSNAAEYPIQYFDLATSKVTTLETSVITITDDVDGWYIIPFEAYNKKGTSYETNKDWIVENITGFNLWMHEEGCSHSGSNTGVWDNRNFYMGDVLYIEDAAAFVEARCEHNLVEKERVEATTEADGYILYECENGCGYTETETIAKLRAPVAQLVEATIDSLTFSFSYPSATKYYVQVYDAAGNALHNKAVTDTQLTLTGLESDSEYTVRVNPYVNKYLGYGDDVVLKTAYDSTIRVNVEFIKADALTQQGKYGYYLEATLLNIPENVDRLYFYSVNGTKDDDIADDLYTVTDYSNPTVLIPVKVGANKIYAKYRVDGSYVDTEIVEKTVAETEVGSTITKATARPGAVALHFDAILDNADMYWIYRINSDGTYKLLATTTNTWITVDASVGENTYMIKSRAYLEDGTRVYAESDYVTVEVTTPAIDITAVKTADGIQFDVTSEYEITKCWIYSVVPAATADDLDVDTLVMVTTETSVILPADSGTAFRVRAYVLIDGVKKVRGSELVYLSDLQ